MYFNRKNTEQKNWRMIKKGKHFLFGCSLVLAIGAVMAAPSVKADEADATDANGVSTSASENESATITSGTNPSTYSAPAETTATPVVTTSIPQRLWNQVLQLKKNQILFKHQA